MAPKITLSGPMRKQLVGDLIASLSRLQADGGLSTMARIGLSMFTSWLVAEHARLDEKYPSTKPQWPTGE